MLMPISSSARRASRFISPLLSIGGAVRDRRPLGLCSARSTSCGAEAGGTIGPTAGARAGSGDRAGSAATGLPPADPATEDVRGHRPDHGEARVEELVGRLNPLED